MDGNHTTRTDSITKCYRAAKKRGFHVFAVRDGGWCASNASAANTFDKYLESLDCGSDGKGGPWANQVYYIIGKGSFQLLSILWSYYLHMRATET